MHNIHIGNTRRGGKRGVKGSLLRYLLDQKNPSKIMSKMLSLIHMFNCLSNVIVYVKAMELFIMYFIVYLHQQSCAHKVPRPKVLCQLGGRAARIKGTTGSTHGLEK